MGQNERIPRVIFTSGVCGAYFGASGAFVAKSAARLSARRLLMMSISTLVFMTVPRTATATSGQAPEGPLTAHFAPP